MAVSPESINSETGDTLWLVETFAGLRYMRAIDAQVFIVNEKPLRQEYITEKYFPDDDVDPIGNYSG